MKNKDYIHVVLADDDQDDRLFFSEAFEELQMKTKVHTFKDGLTLLESINRFDFKIPDLMFLDLNMPKKSGFECLVELRQNKKFAEIPIAIYSTSAAEEDIEKAFLKGANLFIQKPFDFNNLKKILSEVVTNWQSIMNNLNRENFLFRM